MVRQWTTVLIASACLLDVLYSEVPSQSPEDGGGTPRVFCRFVPERAEDFAFENDRVAFRVYGPPLKGKSFGSGVDCWMKRVDYPIIDKWYQENAQGHSYHKDTGEGADLYHVGASMGCGGLAIWHQGQAHQTGGFDKYQIIDLTPQRCVFELTYTWKFQERTIREVKRVTMVLGTQMFSVTSTFTENGAPAKLDLAIGVTTHDGRADASFNLKAGWVACWEPVGGGGLGTGARVDPARVNGMLEVVSPKRDASHALILTSTDHEGRVRYEAGFAWEKAGHVTSLTQWQDYLSQHKRQSGRKAQPAE